jgi:O-antigen/teichoic acid export membrane protein
MSRGRRTGPGSQRAPRFGFGRLPLPSRDSGVLPAQDSDVSPAAGVGALGQQVGRGLGWSFLNNFVNRLGSVLAGIVLARLLVPEDYGVFAVALVVLGAGLSMNELGVSLAVVRWAEGVDRIAPTVASMALVWSMVLYAVCFVSAPFVAGALNAPEATSLIRVLTVGILIDALASVPAALITRHFMQGTKMVIDLTSFVAATAVSIALAVSGLGAWSMVWGFVVSSVVSGVLTIVWAPQRYRPGFDLAAARSLLAFGLPLAGSSMLLFFMLNVDYLVVGHLLGAVQLGFYLLAFNLCSWPANLVSVAVRRVSLAGFSRVAHDPARAGDAFTRSAGLVLALTVPICALLATYARPAVSVLYGDTWLPSVGALRLLCVLGGARVVLELAYDYLVAVGRTRVNLLLQALWVSLLVPALYVGARVDGIRGVALAHALVAVSIVVPAFLLVLRSCSVSLKQLAVVATRPTIAGVTVFASSWIVLHTISGSFTELVVGGGAGLGLSALILAPMRELARGRTSPLAVDALPVRALP